jgi:hypothetical protein
MVAVIQNDGLWDLEKDVNRGNAGDLYYDGDKFDDTTTPLNSFWDDTQGIKIAYIQTFGEYCNISIEFPLELYAQKILGTDTVRFFVRNQQDLPPQLSYKTAGERKNLESRIVVIEKIRDFLYYFDVSSAEINDILINGVELSQFME